MAGNAKLRSRNLVISLSETCRSYLFVTELFRYKYEFCPIIARTQRLHLFRIVSFVISAVTVEDRSYTH